MVTDGAVVGNTCAGLDYAGVNGAMRAREANCYMLGRY